MANIKVTVDYEIIDGTSVTFKSPCDCTAVTGLKVYYPVVTDTESTTTSKTFAFKDAHNNNLSSTGNLFLQDAIIKVILDVTNGNAYIQNPDTNAYLEGKLSGINDSISTINSSLSTVNQKINAANSNISTINSEITDINSDISSLNSSVSSINNSMPKENYSFNSYNSFSGGIIASGTINVAKKLGWCQVFGEFKLNDNVASWTEVLSSTQVPAPKHGTNIYVPSTNWGTSFLRSPRIQIDGSGGLNIRYGANGTYNFSVAYPIA